jgi:hypothetical protein
VSARVCYIQREDRGAILARVRLIGRSTDDAWNAPRGELDPLGTGDAGQAAVWIAEHLESKLGGRTLDRLCLDLDGAVCSWVPASAADPGMLRAVIERDGAAASDDDGFGDAMGQGAGRFPDLPNELGYQTINTEPGGATALAEGRAAVLAVPEVAARRLVDALDEAGVQVEGCVTLWQAMALAFEPRTGSAGADRVVAENSPLIATVLCVPGERVVWAWSRAGSPVAAGAFRTRIGSAGAAQAFLLEDGESEPPAHDGSEASETALGGRLAAEWLAWAAQFGAFPGRVTWIGPLARDGAPDQPGLAPAQIASALRRAAPDATVDVIDDADPIGLTMQRLAERLDDEPRALDRPDARLASLSNRPGRVHRAMYHWLAIVLLIASAAIGAVGYEFWGQRAGAREALLEVRANQRALLEQGAPELAGDPYPTMKLRERLDAQRGPAPVRIPTPKPVLRELETLALVLGNPDYQLESIDISGFAVSFVVKVNDTRAYEDLVDALSNIGGSSINWNSFNPRPDREKIRVNGTGTWSDASAGGDS